MNLYRKPFLNGEKESYFPYDSELLKKYPIFPFYVMDGGAFFLANEVFGKGWDGDTIAEMVMNGKMDEMWTKDGVFDWDLPYKLYCQSKVPAPLEWFVWINRFYFLIPLAHKFLQTGEEEYIEKWYSYFESWIAAHPYIEMEENDVAITKSVWSDDKNISQTVAESEGYIQSLVWRDMQVTWRLLAVIHSIAMMSESKTLTEEKWNRIYDFLKLHASQLLIEGKKYSEMESLHNHVLQMGTALIYIGCLFPELEDSDEYLRIGKKVIEIQLAGAIDADGGSTETCISYSHFIVRYYIECLLLLEKNGKEPIEGLLASIQKQYEWVNQMSTPQGRTLQFNDAYSFDTMEDISVAKQLIPLEVKEKTTRVFSNSRCGVIRNEKFDFYFDGMDLTQVHQHAGRPNYVLYCGKKPLIVDSGCHCYDNHGIHKYFLAEWAHNTVCIYQDDKVNKMVKTADEMQLMDYSETEEYVEFLITGKRGNVCFERRRRFELTDKKVIVIDDVKLSEEAFIESRVHLAPLDLTHDAGEKTIYVHELGTENDIMIQAKGDVTDTFIEYKPAVDVRGEFTYSPVFSARTKAKEACIRIEVEV